VFQAHGVDDNGTVVIRKRLRRPDILRFFASLPPCLIGIEACSASHHWARELIRLGHEVRLMPARYVKPYVQRGKSDALDAEPICEAVSRPTMRFATIKTSEQQAVLTLHHRNTRALPAFAGAPLDRHRGRPQHRAPCAPPAVPRRSARLGRSPQRSPGAAHQKPEAPECLDQPAF